MCSSCIFLASSSAKICRGRIAGIAAILLLAGAPAAAQSGHMHHAAAHADAQNNIEPAGTIDGSVHPELISDQEAITVLWISLMEPSTASPHEQARFTAKTLGMNLSAKDAALVWAAAQNFQTQFAPHLAQAQQLAATALSDPASVSATPAAAASFRAQRAAVAAAVDQLAANTHNNLLAGLSEKGAAALRLKIANVKTHMKIIPPPPM